MRLFVAVNVPEDVKENIVKIIRELPKDSIRPVSRENLHYTLEFLGEVDEDKVNRIIDALEKVTQEPFDIVVKGIGVFPSPNYIRVIWLGVERSEDITSLAHKVENVLRPLGFKPDRPFSPHLTIARVKSKVNITDLLEKYSETVFGRFIVDSFSLMQSTLTRNGPIYREVRNFPLLKDTRL